MNYELIKDFLKLPQTFNKKELHAAGHTALLTETIEGKIALLEYQGFMTMAKVLRDAVESRVG